MFCLFLLWSLVVAADIAAVASQAPEPMASTWTLANVRCAPDDSALATSRLKSHSAIHCVLEASRISEGLLVAQFNGVTQLCSIFSYQSVCRELSPGGTPDCEVFFRFPVDHRSISAKLTNLWIGDAVSRLENLVCQADKDLNRLYPVGVQLTSYGAVFDGAASHALLNRSSISFATGLTWLLRIKRTPRSQPLFEFNDCSTLGTSAVYDVHMWEHPQARQLYARAERATGTVLPVKITQTNQLPASSEEWINIGYTTTASGNSTDIFLGSSFLARSSVSSTADPMESPPINKSCLMFGMRAPTTMFQGAMRAFALASSAMSEAEINGFFAGVA